ncbi:Phosducin-like protein 2 [Gonapodya sp. JEL0774]|nr:Phosducin-like protein 2 [Gonapodya sp. JEL0774]
MSNLEGAILERFERSQQGLAQEDAREARERAGQSSLPSSSGANGRKEMLGTEEIDQSLANILSDTALRQQIENGGPQTGPKGVMADYRFHEKQERARAAVREKELARVLMGKGLKSGWMQRQERREEREKWGDHRRLEEGLDDYEDESDESGDEEVQFQFEGTKWDSRSLAQYLDGMAIGEFDLTDRRGVICSGESPKKSTFSGAAHQRHSHKSFGIVTEITQDDYVESIDSEAPHVTVVIHLYQRNHPLCITLNSHLDKLATKYPRVKFLRIISTDADPDFDDVALPAILGYRNGDLVANLVHIQDQMSTGSFDICDVENILLRHNLLGNGHLSGGGMVHA